MTRGMGRFWSEKDGVDTCWARVETTPGQWADGEQAEYDNKRHQPAFWDLPLKEDYVEGTIRDSIIHEELRIRREIEAPALLVAMGVFCVLFVVAVVGYVLFAWLGLLS